MSDNSKKEKQKPGRDARRSGGEKGEKQKDEEGRVRYYVLEGKNK